MAKKEPVIVPEIIAGVMEGNSMATDLLELGEVRVFSEDIEAIRAARSKSACEEANGVWRKPPPWSKRKGVCARRPRFLAGMGCDGIGGILPEDVNFGSVLFGDATGILSATAIPRVIEALITPKKPPITAAEKKALAGKKTMGGRIAKVALGGVGATLYFLTKKSFPLGVALGTVPGAVEAIAQFLSDAIAKPIEKKMQEKAGGITGVGQIEPAQIKEIEEVARRMEGVGVGQVAETLEEFREEEVPVSPGIPSPIGQVAETLEEFEEEEVPVSPGIPSPIGSTNVG